MGHTTHTVARSIRVAAGLVCLEALALAVFAVLDLLDARSGRVVLALGTSLFFLVYAGGQLLAVRGLLRLDSWARGPLVFTQLIQLGLAWGLRSSSPVVAVVLAVVALAVLACLLSPTTTQLLLDTGEDKR